MISRPLYTEPSFRSSARHFEKISRLIRTVLCQYAGSNIGNNKSADQRVLAGGKRKGSTGLDYKGYLIKALRILRLDKSAALDVAKDEKAFLPGVIVLVIGGVAAGAGMLMTGVVAVKDVTFLILAMPFLNVVSYALFMFVFHLIARLFGGKATFGEYFRAVSFGSIITWTQVVPLFGMVASLWSIPVNIFILEKVHGLRRIEAVAIMSLMMLAALAMLRYMHYI